MTRKKKLVFLGSVALIALTLASLAGATFVFAQEFPLPIPFGGHGGMGGFGGRGMGRSGGHGSGSFAWAGGGEWTMIDTAAEVLGLSERHVWRIMAAYREEGAAALAHGNRGRVPSNATLALIWQQVVAINHDNRPRTRAIEVTITGTKQD